ncbi:MAG TPA: ABC transporter permease [Acidimicrobiales bacterium]|nr:ABC transporter permease [Acidimicrobiales bacterium]
MTAYLVRRFGISVIVVFGIAFLSFLALHIIAPSPGRAVLGTKATIYAVNAFNKQNGFDRPVYAQFITYLNQLLHGNLGYSYKLNQSVGSLIVENAPHSMWLSGSSLVLSILIAIPLGIFQAVKRNSVPDHAATAVAFTAYSMPQNFLGILLIGGLAISLHIFPFEASQSEAIVPYILAFRANFLPIMTLTITSVAGYSRYMRSSALDALAQDYIRLARSKGLAERTVLRRHLFRNASLAMVTLVGLSIPALIGGNLIVENLFNSHGLGLLFINELSNEDFNTVIALTLLGGVATVIGNLVADIALTIADPRIRIG